MMKINLKQQHYINGVWIEGSGDRLVSHNPADGSPIWEGKTASEEEANMAFTAARQALAGWSALSLGQRIEYLQHFSRIVADKRSDLARLISLEAGKPRWEALAEVSLVIAKVSLSIQAYTERTPEKQVVATEAAGHLRYKPHGVVAVLGPFNFPAHLSNGHIVPALLAGNTVIYKPSELTPGVADFIVQCWQESGLPAGVLNCVQGGVSCAQHVLKQDVQGVFFTGSYQAGLQIHKQFSERPEVILALEMGGNNPLVIDEVSHREAALYHTVLSVLISAGQRCTCARRLFIPEGAYGDGLLEQLLQTFKAVRVGGYSEAPEPFMGPVISHAHALCYLEAQQKLKKMGGELLLEMSLLRENSGFLSPGLIDMTQVVTPPDEEIFAPFVQLYRYQSFEEALALANQTRYGLAAGLLSDSKTRFQQFYETIRAGLINWNRPTTGAASNLPFGGVGWSGNHRPSAWFAADYCAYPVASLEQSSLLMPEQMLPGIDITHENV